MMNSIMVLLRSVNVKTLYAVYYSLPLVYSWSLSQFLVGPRGIQIDSPTHSIQITEPVDRMLKSKTTLTYIWWCHGLTISIDQCVWNHVLRYHFQRSPAKLNWNVLLIARYQVANKILNHFRYQTIVLLYYLPNWTWIQLFLYMTRLDTSIESVSQTPRQ